MKGSEQSDSVVGLLLLSLKQAMQGLRVLAVEVYHSRKPPV